jgi:hypothetical protein
MVNLMVPQRLAMSATLLRMAEIGYVKIKPGVNDIERHDAKQSADSGGILGGIWQLNGFLIFAVSDGQSHALVGVRASRHQDGKQRDERQAVRLSGHNAPTQISTER